MGENLEDVKIMAQSVGSHQEHSYNKHKLFFQHREITRKAGLNKVTIITRPYICGPLSSNVFNKVFTFMLA